MFNFFPIEEFPPGGDVSLNFDYDVLITCESTEERGCASYFHCEKQCRSVENVRYNSDDLSLWISGREVPLFDFFESDIFLSFQSLLFDATNLDFAEMAIILRHVADSGLAQNIGFFYSEPLVYRDKVTTPNQVRAFDISEKVNEIDIIPSFYSHLGNEVGAYLLAFLGFEDVRLSRALNSDEGNDFDGLSVAFTVPPFQTGWEGHALMANSLVLENESNLKESFFVSGNQYISAYRLIMEQKRYAERAQKALSIAPLGAKPSCIAVALAAASDKDLNILYDFPQRKPSSASGVGRSHHYRVEIIR